MALDPSIPLSFKAPEPASPLASIGQLMQMRGLASEVALRGAQTEQAQANTTDIQAQAQGRQRDLADQQTLQQAMGDADHPEYKAAAAKGDFSFLDGKVQPASQLKFATAQLGKIKEQAAVDSTTLANTQAYHKQLGDTIFGLSQLPVEDRAGAAASAIGELSKLPGAKKLADLSTMDFSDAGLKKYAADNNAATEYWGAVNTQKTAQQKIDTDAALAQKDLGQGAAGQASALETRSKMADQQYGQAVQSIASNPPKDAQAYSDLVDSLPHATAARMLAAMPIANYDPAKAAALLSRSALTPEQAATTAQAQAREAETLRHNRVDESTAGGRLAVERQRLAQTTGGVQLNPAQQSIAQKLADGEFNPAQLTRFPDKEALVAGAIAINPNWSPQTYATKRAFTDPQAKQSQNLGTISRIVEHIGRFESNSSKMGFAPVFAMGTNLSGDAAALHSDSKGISAELEKLLAGGVGTEGQTKAWEKALTSPLEAVRKGAIDEISQLIGGQYAGMNQSYKAGTGKDLPQDQFVSPHGREWLQSNGINVTGAASGAKPAGGGVPTPASQAEFAALPKGAQFKKPNDPATYVKQ
jgi:hypothetical protein